MYILDRITGELIYLKQWPQIFQVQGWLKVHDEVVQSGCISINSQARF